MKMVDLRRTSEEKAEEMSPLGSVSEYPFGTCMSFDENTLEKLGVDHDDWEVGDVFHLEGMFRVTSVSENENESGKKKRVEMQCVLLGAECESTEYEDEED